MPPPKFTISQWADEYRFLSPESAAEPGKWRTSRAEFQRGIMDAVTDPRVRTVVLMKSAQVGATEILGNIVGYFIHQDPAPILLLQPTLEMAEAWSKDRLMPMLRDTPALSSLIADARSRDSGNSLLHKLFPGGQLSMAGANSPASLASRPIRIVLADEVDRYPKSAGAEGDPWSLAAKRSTTFWNRKFIAVSTPTIKGSSRIEGAFEASDQRYYLVPCPHCGMRDRLLWANVRWPSGRPREARYVCPHCAAEITDSDKPRMIAQGHWQASAPFDDVAGFHICELYSPWVTFGQMAAAFVDAQRTPEKLQAWINTSLGETWVERGEAPSWERVHKQRSDYSTGEVPDNVIALVAGVDVQKDRLIYVVRGFGREMFSALIEHGEMYGDTDQPEVWSRLADLLASEWAGKPLRLMCVDSGFRAAQVYAFARMHQQVRATKGHDTLSQPVKSSRIDVAVAGGASKTGLHLWHVDSGYFKTWIHGRIDWPTTQPGAWILPTDVSEEYCKQLVAESCITLPNGKRVWKRMSPNNHALDCEVYATAAAYMLQIHRMPKATPDAAPQRSPPNAARIGRRILSSGIAS